jgi:hypothetical protein
MKLLRSLLPVILLLVTIASRAQATKPLFTDDDLKKYAITQDSIKGMQQTLNAGITEMVQKNTVMKVERYNELFKIIGDEAKLAETKATPEELAFVKEVATKRADGTAKISATFQALAKDYVGLKAFNAIKKSLATDEELKVKYETLSKDLESKS